MGYALVFRVAIIAGAPIGGAIYDATQTYDLSFYLAAGVYVIASLLIVMAQVILY